jgi:putative nucleotidyltransferase with HDIG domain
VNNLETNRLKEDLKATVTELSDTYEELSLLYRLSEEFSGLGVDGICYLLLKKALSSLSVRTGVVLFLDEDSEELYTQAYIGDWDADTAFKKETNILWRVIRSNKAIAVCNHNTHEERLDKVKCNSLLITPLTGKKQIIGVLMVADKTDGREFYSGDIKLLTTIASQAALFIENALLTQEMQVFLIETIRSFVKALEASSLWTAGHTERVTRYALSIAELLDLDVHEIEKLRVSSLLHDIGKIATPNEILNKNSKLDDAEWFEIRRHPIVGAEILSGLSSFKEVIECIRYHHEHYDGTGIHGLCGEDIPLMARILAVADAFDAMMSDRPYRKKKTIEETVTEIITCTGKQFDPNVVQACISWIKSTHEIIPPEPESHI